MSNEFFGFDDNMFNSLQKIKFVSFKNGEHRFRVLPPFAQGKLYHQVDLHWGYTDENNKKKALKCTKYEYKTCAICDEADRAKAEYEMLEKNPQGFSSPEELKMAIDEKKKRHSDLKKKASYLWNIMADDGVPGVLQLSWNGHEQLLNKVKFLWEQSKINVTDINNNQQLWCSRTGMGVMTRYQFELIANSGRKLENITTLTDLTKVYKETTPAELKLIADRGYVPQTQEDPNDRNFAAQLPAGTNMAAQANQMAPTPQLVQQPTQQNPVEVPTPVYQAQFDQATTPQFVNTTKPEFAPTSQMQGRPPVEQPAAVISQPVVNAVNIDDDITKMQNLLNQR
jgi:hypothetical protein